MAYEPVLGKFLVDCGHDAVSCHLRNHAGGGDGKGEAIAFHKSLVGKRETFHRKAVDESHIRTPRQPGQGFAHGVMGSPEDVDFIDVIRLRHRHGPDNCRIRSDLSIELLTPFF